MGRALGSIWFYVIPIRRGVATRAVARAFPEMTAAEVRGVVLGNFQHLGCSLLESIAYVAYPEERLRDLLVYGGLQESIYVHRNAGHGVVGMSAHIGNFEMCTDGFGLLHKIPMLLVARLPKAGFAKSMLEAFRGRNPLMEVFEPKGSAPRVVEALRAKNSVLAFVIDQNIRRGRGIFIPFLGELANTTTGFSSLRRKADAGFMVVEIQRRPGGTHLVHAEPLLPSNHPNERVAAINDTLAVSNRIQAFVRERPEQWFWVHRRWKARPEPGDLVRTDAGLERFARGKIAAFIPEDRAAAPDAAEAIRRLKDAGIAVFVGRTDVATREKLAAENKLDLTSSLVLEAPGGLIAIADRFLEQTVTGAGDVP
jgi:KDO2-lipid IV(A) lauroyltransferase